MDCIYTEAEWYEKQSEYLNLAYGQKRPELWEEVLVHFAETDAYIVAEAGRDEYDSLVWWTLDRNYDISPSDRWAYLHPQEISEGTSK